MWALLSSGGMEGQGQTFFASFPWGKDLGGPTLLFSFSPSTWEARAKASDQRWSLQTFHPGLTKPQTQMCWLPGKANSPRSTSALEGEIALMRKWNS